MLDFHICSEGNRLLLQLVQVLFVDTNSLELIDLCLLYVLDLLSFVIDLLADFTTLLQEVEPVLLLLGIVIGDLGPDLLRVIDEGLLLLLLDLLLLGLNLPLLLNLSHVVFSLDTSLVGETLLLLRELPLPGNFQVSLDSLSLELLESFSFSRLSLTLLESPLGP